ncbi:hypothetical protein [Pedomonas mirosovicensis]|uniref:hypothetical protein n=1 Tax=Pedomonas mirosovicensis TaxID=2908641 RepID=UPI002166E4E4|nr:hypothetical protein [Pedomonas mirosovicensis]MCH8686352.1 hypothetical protein [Pedomonas mirosovicensis]
MAILALIFAAAVGAAAPQAAAPAPVIQRIPAQEARQGVASDGRYVYAIANNAIGKYDKATGRKVAGWTGDRQLFPHINSCTMVEEKLVCAASNYPAVPQASSVEFFDPATMTHVGSRSLGPGTGSLTVMMRHDNSWWGVFANYDAKGGEPGRDHRYTTLVRMNDQFQREEAWLFPEDVLARFAPSSCSGAAWGPDNRLYVTGHDRRELYVLELPKAGGRLAHVETIAIATGGQAIDWDGAQAGVLWSIERGQGEMVASRIRPAE